MTTIPHTAATPGLSDEDLMDILAQLEVASAELAGEAKVPVSVRALIRDLPDRLRADAPAGALSNDVYLSEQVYAGMARAAAALLQDDGKVARRSARLALEQVRQGLRNIAEARPFTEDQSPQDLVVWLEATLDATGGRLARLVNTTPATWRRWRAGDQTPDEVGQLRLSRLANVVAHLRYSLTPTGVLDWFDRPHPALKGGQAAPAELLDDAEGYRIVLDLAARLRTLTAT